MRRPGQGATSRPGPARPGNGFGRPMRSRPVLIQRDERANDPAWWFERELELQLGRLDASEPDRSAKRA
jgi:hypothetical protein